MIEQLPGLTHLVLYQTNPDNASAVLQIIDKANEYLRRIPGVQYFQAGPRLDNKRAVGEGFEYNVGLNLGFQNQHGMEAYMQHPDHLKFVKFVLNGWMLEDTDKTSAEDRKTEFIDHILNASPKQKRPWTIDATVPTQERVWQAERVYDFGF